MVGGWCYAIIDSCFHLLNKCGAVYFDLRLNSPRIKFASSVLAPLPCAFISRHSPLSLSLIISLLRVYHQLLCSYYLLAFKLFTFYLQSFILHQLLLSECIFQFYRVWIIFFHLSTIFDNPRFHWLLVYCLYIISCCLAIISLHSLSLPLI